MNHYRIEAPGPDDAVAVGQAHLQSWLETYPNPDLGIDDEWIRENVGFVDSDEGAAFRAEVFQEAETSPERVLYRVVRSDDAVVGFVHATRDAGKVRLAALYVTEEAKGTGVAHEAMQLVLNWAGDDPITFEVVSYNTRALRFYERYGFRTSGEPQLWKERVPIVDMKRA